MTISQSMTEAPSASPDRCGSARGRDSCGTVERAMVRHQTVVRALTNETTAPPFWFYPKGA
jgi:hypothetical protein